MKPRRLSYTFLTIITLVSACPFVDAAPGALRFTVKLLTVDTNEGCAVGDFNRDGQLDVVAGRNWYPAPDFAPRPLRAIAEFGLDYSENNGEHAYDVNGDGWIDVLAGSFIPTEVFWYENPGKQGLEFGKQWKQHLLLDTKVSSNEMTWFRDVDGDGIPELLVNSWNKKAPMLVWQLAKDAEGSPTLERRTIAESGNGHGMGFGDINGDGLEDITFQSGWYERPADDLFGRPWKLHSDWNYPHASCPMIIVDLNVDGRNDVIWARGHGYGVFWMEQLEPASDGKTQWKEHKIDDSFSQGHALLWTDLDGDGQPDLITGKRVRGHSGGDPGAKEPPAVYYYTWDKKTFTFTRHTVAEGTVGTGLQIRAGDLNGDGRVDLVVPGKTGTYILFNEGPAGE